MTEKPNPKIVLKDGCGCLKLHRPCRLHSGASRDQNKTKGYIVSPGKTTHNDNKVSEAK